MKSIVSALAAVTVASGMLLAGPAFGASGFSGGGARPSSPSRSYTPPSPSRSYTPTSPSRALPAPIPAPSRSSSTERPASSWSGSTTYNSTSGASASRAYDERQERAQRESQRLREAEAQRARQEREAQLMASRQAEQARDAQLRQKREAERAAQAANDRNRAPQREQSDYASARTAPREQGTNWTGAILAGTAAAVLTNAAMAHDSKGPGSSSPSTSTSVSSDTTPASQSDRAKQIGASEIPEISTAGQTEPLVNPDATTASTRTSDAFLQLGSTGDDFTSYLPIFSGFLVCVVLAFGVLSFVSGRRSEGTSRDMPQIRMNVASGAGEAKTRKVNYKL